MRGFLSRFEFILLLSLGGWPTTDSRGSPLFAGRLSVGTRYLEGRSRRHRWALTDSGARIILTDRSVYQERGHAHRFQSHSNPEPRCGAPGVHSPGTGPGGTPALERGGLVRVPSRRLDQ